MLTPSHDSSRLASSSLSSDGLPDNAAPETCRESRALFYQVRSARRQDIQALADILASSFHSQSGVMRYVYPILRLGIYEDLQNRLRSPTKHYICLTAVDRQPAGNGTLASGQADMIVGTVEMALKKAHPWQPNSRDCLYISNLAVHAEYRRQGIALKLLQTCEQIARDWGFQSLCLHVLETNAQARGLYRKAGYQIQKTETGLKTWLLSQPRRFLLRKSLD